MRFVQRLLAPAAAALLALAFTQPLHAQNTINLEGSVKSEGAPIANAQVTVVNTATQEVARSTTRTNGEFRILDPADELAYLALECERLCAPEVGHWLLDGYREASGDAPPDGLIHFYQSCRAVLRAKLALWHLRDDGRHPPGKWVATAREYLELAQRHAGQAAG